MTAQCALAHCLSKFRDLFEPQVKVALIIILANIIVPFSFVFRKCQGCYKNMDQQTLCIDKYVQVVQWVIIKICIAMNSHALNLKTDLD